MVAPLYALPSIVPSFLLFSIINIVLAGIKDIRLSLLSLVGHYLSHRINNMG